MYKVRADLNHNRLYLTLSGFLSAEETIDIKQDIITEVNKLSPGFDVINDISLFRLGLDETASVLNAVVDFLIEKKVNRVVRVVGSARAGMIQIAQATKKHEKYTPVFVPTIAEAEEYLRKK